MLDALDTSARRQKIHLIGRAKTLWQTSVEVTPNYILVRESNSSSKSALKTAYDTLEVFQAEGNKGLEDVLKTFTKSLYDDVVSTLLKKHQANQVVGEWTFRETEEKNRVGSSGMAATTSRGPTWRLEWMCDTENNPTETMSPSADTSMSVTAWEGTFGFMERILGFVAQRVLLGREPLCHWTGNRFFGKPEACLHSLNLEALGLESRRLGNDNGLIMEPLIDALNASCIPASLQSDELGRLTNMSADLGRFIHSFLSTMQDSLLISAPAETRLAKFISSFEQNYIDKRRCVILNQARDLLMQNDYHNTVQVGVEVEEDLSDIGKRDRTAAFKLHKASVSVTSSELIKLCRKTMDEAVQQQVLSAESALAVLSASLYRASRETLDLFRAIIPTAHGYIIKNLPRTAAVFHNDCVFLAHHCLTLGLEYREKFPPVDEGNLQGTLLRQTCMFVDMVPLFRDLAERSLGDMLELQANQIVETVGQRIVDLGRSLESNEIVVEWSEAETGLTAGVYHLRHLLQAWQTVLSKEILNSSMWYLCDVVLTLFLNQVFNARDISASACQFSSTLFRRATDEITDLVSNDTTGSRVWDRFSAVSTFFDMNLNDIEIALADGVFIEITGQELTRLIVATFDDSPKRRELVAALVSP
jgi:centromere/kinetochore protein ZW10